VPGDRDWEQDPSQSADGGGLRFVMDPVPNHDHPAQIEVKIESFLQDTSKVFVETQFNWLKPQVSFDPKRHLDEMNQYIENQVRQFMIGEQKSNDAQK